MKKIKLVHNSVDVRFSKFYKVPLKKDAKVPSISGWQNTAIQNYTGHHGIITGKRNNLIVLVIDNKDEGIQEFEQYIEQFSEPDTFKVRTQGGGYHYYFNYKVTDPDANFLIENYITNSAKYRGKGIDIRTNGGFIVAPRCKIFDKAYEIVNHVPIIDMPTTLCEWLLESRTELKPKQKPTRVNELKHTNELEYFADDKQLQSILDRLGSDWYDIYDNWLKVLTCFKSLDKYELFDAWSKQSSRYDADKNRYMWEHNSGVIDINYLTHQLKMPPIEKCKRFTSSAHIPSHVQIKKVDKMFVSDSLTYDEFNSHPTIVIKSCTGTGKTTAVAQYIKQYMGEHKKQRSYQ
jgi:hypothetical protein